MVDERQIIELSYNDRVLLRQQLRPIQRQIALVDNQKIRNGLNNVVSALTPLLHSKLLRQRNRMIAQSQLRANMISSKFEVSGRLHDGESGQEVGEPDQELESALETSTWQSQLEPIPSFTKTKVIPALFFPDYTGFSSGHFAMTTIDMDQIHTPIRRILHSFGYIPGHTNTFPTSTLNSENPSTVAIDQDLDQGDENDQEEEEPDEEHEEEQKNELHESESEFADDVHQENHLYDGKNDTETQNRDTKQFFYETLRLQEWTPHAISTAHHPLELLPSAISSGSPTTNGTINAQLTRSHEARLELSSVTTPALRIWERVIMALTFTPLSSLSSGWGGSSGSSGWSDSVKYEKEAPGTTEDSTHSPVSPPVSPPVLSLEAQSFGFGSLLTKNSLPVPNFTSFLTKPRVVPIYGENNSQYPREQGIVTKKQAKNESYGFESAHSHSQILKRLRFSKKSYQSLISTHFPALIQSGSSWKNSHFSKLRSKTNFYFNRNMIRARSFLPSSSQNDLPLNVIRYSPNTLRAFNRSYQKNSTQTIRNNPQFYTRKIPYTPLWLLRESLNDNMPRSYDNVMGDWIRDKLEAQVALVVDLQQQKDEEFRLNPSFLETCQAIISNSTPKSETHLQAERDALRLLQATIDQTPGANLAWRDLQRRTSALNNWQKDQRKKERGKKDLFKKTDLN